MTPPAEKISQPTTANLPMGPVAGMIAPSTGAGDVASQMDLRRNGGSTSHRTHVVRPSVKSEAEQLFDSQVHMKVMAAQVAMHLTGDWRSRLFRQLDSLLDADEWCSGDQYPKIASWWTLLRTLLHIAPPRRPGLGLTDEGYLVGAWDTGKDKLTMTFLPNDEVRWSLSRVLNGKNVRGAGQAPIDLLSTVLAGYNPEHWFVGEPTSPLP
jgi:hypothetical protein